MESMSENGIGLVVFDWAGTTVDYASSAPGDVFRMVFDDMDVRLTREEICRPMGMEKKEHIRQLLSCESGSRQWLEKYGRDWTEDDVRRIFETFEKKLCEVVADYSHVLPGVSETVEKLRGMGIKIGSTTGYLSNIMEQVLPTANREGYNPDCVVTPDVTGAGRPTPFMIFECMRQLNVYPPCRVLKVGDTIVDIQEGKNAGAWSIGILTGSNLLGLTEEEYSAMDPEKLEERKALTRQKYMDAGADAVIDHFTELPELIRNMKEEAQPLSFFSALSPA